MSTNQSYPLLGKLRGPEDLRALPESELPALCGELRRCLIERVSENGGHLASNLGMVEATVALHRVFSSPADHILFDVGHQSYVHKLLTGRFDRFDTLRLPGGISGFPRRDESEHDAFIAGHSGNSLSAAVGFAEADLLRGSSAKTVAVVGDGAYTNGMIHEALNNCRPELPLVILLNENEMSISKNIGAFASYLAGIRSTKRYYRAKKRTKNFLGKIPLIGKPLVSGITKVKQRLKNNLYASNLFEQLGIYYFGPVDGHDLAAMTAVLEEARDFGGCCVVHIKTKKGCGYPPAEIQPGKYHGVSPAGTPEKESFSARFGALLTEKADADPSICAVTAAMADGTGLCAFREAHPDRFFDVGIAEEHAVTFSAGLAAAGMKPVTAIYSTFLQRGYDQLLHDFALQKLPGTFAVDRAGLASRDGPTHHGIFDVAFCSEIPGAEIFAPLDFASLDRCLTEALRNERLSFIRYHSGGEGAFSEKFPYINKEAFLRGNIPAEAKLLLVGYGRLCEEILTAAETLRESGIPCGILALERLKPYDETAAAVEALLPEGGLPILFAEEGIYAGGAGMLLGDALRELPRGSACSYKVLAVKESFGIQSVNEPIRRTCGIDADAITAAAREIVQ